VRLRIGDETAEQTRFPQCFQTSLSRSQFKGGVLLTVIFWGEVQPLTTIWTPPPGCPGVVQLLSIDWDNKFNTAGQSCAPPNYANVWRRYGYFGLAYPDHEIFSFGATSGLPAPTETGESVGLSRGTIAGIAVGVVVALALILAAVGWFLLHRYRTLSWKLVPREDSDQTSSMWKKLSLSIQSLTAVRCQWLRSRLRRMMRRSWRPIPMRYQPQGGQYQRKPSVGDRPELPAQVSNTNDTGAVEMDATPAQSIPAHHAAKILPAHPYYQHRLSFMQRLQLVPMYSRSQGQVKVKIHHKQSAISWIVRLRSCWRRKPVWTRGDGF